MPHKFLLPGEVRAKIFSDALFKMVFGRNPNLKRDKNFLLHYLATIDKTSEETIESYLAQGITKSQLRAIYETGISPTEDDYQQFPRPLLNRWEDIAADPESGAPIDQRLAPALLTGPTGEASTTLYLELSNTVLRLCHLLDTGAPKARSSNVGVLFLYLLSRVVQLLRSIRVLINNDEDASVLSLGRGLYECFARLLLANRRPDLAYGLVLTALVDGRRFEFVRNRIGKVERRKVRDIKSGEEHRVDFSLTEIFASCDADRDAEVHPLLYLTLSAEIHPTAELLFEHVEKKGFLLHRHQDTLYVVFMLGYLLFLVWREVAVFPLLSKQDRIDAKHALSIVRESMLTIATVLSPAVSQKETSEFEALFHAIHRALVEPYNDKYWQTVV